MNDKEGFYVDISGGSPIREYYTPDFMIRNKYVDSKGQTHYSPFAYVKCKKDGTYQVFEVDGDKIKDYIGIDDNDDVIIDIPTDNIEIDTDSDIYDGEVIITNDDDTKVDLWSRLNSLFTLVSEFPTFFAKVFSFYPNWIVDAIGFGIVSLVLIATLKAIF